MRQMNPVGDLTVGHAGGGQPGDLQLLSGEYRSGVRRGRAPRVRRGSRQGGSHADDEARRRIERDLHDGAQQQLIALGLQLCMVEASLLPGLDPIRHQLSQAVNHLTGVSQDLQEISRGIHPAILSKGGLGPAIKALPAVARPPSSWCISWAWHTMPKRLRPCRDRPSRRGCRL
nr:hypothetical protein GCM10020063_039720 [Dactylosporangium thailandense]